MVGGIGRIEGPMIGALLYFLATRLFGEYGASYLIALGLMTLLFAPGRIWGLLSKLRDWRWFPVGYALRQDGMAIGRGSGAARPALSTEYRR